MQTTRASWKIRKHSTANSIPRSTETRSLLCKHFAPLRKQIKISSQFGVNRPTEEASILLRWGSVGKQRHSINWFRIVFDCPHLGDYCFWNLAHLLRSYWQDNNKIRVAHSKFQILVRNFELCPCYFWNQQLFSSIILNRSWTEWT